MRTLLLCLFLSTALLKAQETAIYFQPRFQDKALAITEQEEGAAAGANKVEVLRFYTSNFTLRHGGKVVFKEKNSHHLIDAADAGSLAVRLDLPADLQYDELAFTLGVDSLTAAGGVFGGDLDPTNGMYWTWRSGYINFKLEGTAPECPARNNRYQFHVGGFRAPFNTERRIRLPLPKNKAIRVNIDLDRFFALLDLTSLHQAMSPNEAAMVIADRLVGIFSTTP